MDICCFLHETCIYGTEYREIREVLLLLKKKKKKKRIVTLDSSFIKWIWDPAAELLAHIAKYFTVLFKSNKYKLRSH